MLRAIGSVIVGYLVMAVITFCSLTGAFFALGADRAYEPGVFDVSKLWMAVWVVVGVVAALAGGWVCRAIAKTNTPPRVLAGIVLVLGTLMAVMAMNAPPTSEVRPPDLGVMDAMTKARAPTWMNFANGLIGFAGVLVGGGMGKQRAGGKPV